MALLSFCELAQQTTKVTDLPPVSVARDWLDKVSLTTAVILTLVGVVGVFIAIRTLRAILQQATFMARQNEVERPWLFMAPYQFKLTPMDKLDWRIWNNGRTVARIIEVGGSCRKCVAMDKILQVPAKYSVVSSFYRVPIAPNGSTDFWSSVEDGRGGDRLTDRDISDIAEQRDELAAYCFVKYEDQFGKEHESRFCYYYAVPFQEFRINLRAPAEYHRCT